MKTKHILCDALILSGLTLLLTGCHGIGTQRFTALALAQASALESSSRIVLDVVYHPETVRADYNLHENLSMLAPIPKHWKFDAALQVKRVVKGDFTAKTLQIHWLRGLTREQYNTLGISPQFNGNLTNGTPLRIGFNGSSGKHLKNLKMTLQP